MHIELNDSPLLSQVISSQVSFEDESSQGGDIVIPRTSGYETKYENSEMEKFWIKVPLDGTLHEPWRGPQTV